jgi:hypothetical protein
MPTAIDRLEPLDSAIICPACNGAGWLEVEIDGDPDRPSVERCDTCMTYATDAGARAAHAKYWFAHPTSPKPNSLNWYTVIGLWDDTGHVYVCSFYASDPHAAMRQAAQSGKESDDGTRLVWAGPDQILGAYRTFPDPDSAAPFCCACEDAGKAAYIEDLRGDS